VDHLVARGLVGPSIALGVTGRTGVPLREDHSGLLLGAGDGAQAKISNAIRDKSTPHPVAPVGMDLSAMAQDARATAFCLIAF
jgi:hypothetical protein